MKNKIGILYATVDGQTLKISNKLKEVLTQNGNTVEIYSIDDFDKEIDSFDKFIIGSSIRYGKHNSKIIEFIKTHKDQFEKTKTAFFSVNLVARKPDKNTPETNPYYIKFLKEVDWKPYKAAVFAGKIDYKIYSFWDKLMIQLIMWMTKGPTNPDAEIEYTDWEKVKEFGVLIDNM
jgi:menaquinone-dependent protoporphyrinogen oxidase